MGYLSGYPFSDVRISGKLTSAQLSAMTADDDDLTAATASTASITVLGQTITCANFAATGNVRDISVNERAGEIDRSGVSADVQVIHPGRPRVDMTLVLEVNDDTGSTLDVLKDWQGERLIYIQRNNNMKFVAVANILSVETSRNGDDMTYTVNATNASLKKPQWS